MTKPAWVNNLATSAVLLMFSVLSSGEKFKFLFKPILKLSPSKLKTLKFLSNNFFSTFFAMVLLPAPDNPVSQIIPGL